MFDTKSQSIKTENEMNLKELRRNKNHSRCRDDKIALVARKAFGDGCFAVHRPLRCQKDSCSWQIDDGNRSCRESESSSWKSKSEE